MARLLQHHADSGTFAGLGLLFIASSIALALGLSSAHLPLQHAAPDLTQGLQNLLAAIRVRG